MKLAKLNHAGAPSLGIVKDDAIDVVDLSSSPANCLADVLESDDISGLVQSLPVIDSVAVSDAELLPPIDQQEVWAAGVTYKRSQTARMEESEAAASCYDRVYVADRPELFLKATPHRVRGHGGALRIRKDATWNVPEPEVTLALNRSMTIVGYTVGNDMSSRDIEGENPLYLPQAKVYDQCAGLGPWITLADAVPPPEAMTIHLTIQRDGATVFDQSTSAGQMARSFDDLAAWLARDNNIPGGAFLMTGTGIVPDSNFTLTPGDVVSIRIEGIGTLTNTIVQG